MTKQRIEPLLRLSKNFHAHVYFDDIQFEQALACYSAIQSSFAELTLGRIHEKLVGPHLKRQFQIAIDRKTVTEFVIWLDKNRGRLSVLVHPLTSNDLEDHTHHALWLGTPIPLNLDVLEASNQSD